MGGFDVKGFFGKWGWFLLLGAAAFLAAYLFIGRKAKSSTTGSNVLAGQSSQNGANGQPVVEYVPTTGDSYTNVNYTLDSNNVANKAYDGGVINDPNFNIYQGGIAQPVPGPHPRPVPPSPGTMPPIPIPGGHVPPVPPSPGHQPPGPVPITHLPPPSPGPLPIPGTVPPSPPMHPPGPPPQPIPPGPGGIDKRRFGIYTVRSGDTLHAIAAKHGMTWQSLYQLNKGVIDSEAAKHNNPIPGGPWNNIFGGEALQVPVA